MSPASTHILSALYMCVYECASMFMIKATNMCKWVYFCELLCVSVCEIFGSQQTPTSKQDLNILNTLIWLPITVRYIQPVISISTIQRTINLCLCSHLDMMSTTSNTNNKKKKKTPATSYTTNKQTNTQIKLPSLLNLQ